MLHVGVTIFMSYSVSLKIIFFLVLTIRHEDHKPILRNIYLYSSRRVTNRFWENAERDSNGPVQSPRNVRLN